MTAGNERIAMDEEIIRIVAELAEKTVEAVAAACDSYGGYLYICDGSGNELLHTKLGEPPDDEAGTYKAFSWEKAKRLLRHPDHELSWQSRDPDNNKWGGAIRLPSGHIVSFSGFPELIDEAFCMSLARFMQWINGDDITRMTMISDNPNYSTIHELVVRCAVMVP